MNLTNNQPIERHRPARLPGGGIGSEDSNPNRFSAQDTGTAATIPGPRAPDTNQHSVLKHTVRQSRPRPGRPLPESIPRLVGPAWPNPKNGIHRNGGGLGSRRAGSGTVSGLSRGLARQHTGARRQECTASLFRGRAIDPGRRLRQNFGSSAAGYLAPAAGGGSHRTTAACFSHLGRFRFNGHAQFRIHFLRHGHKRNGGSRQLIRAPPR